MKNSLIRDLFYNHSDNLIHKWDHYLDIYSKHLSQYQGKNPVLLEIGISHGGSIQLWKKFFGQGCQIYAIDINPDCKKLEEENVKIFIGSQNDVDFIKRVASQLPELDFVIDDGGHFMDQQSISFEILFTKVKQGGQYIVEDTHTSYWPEFEGGLRRQGTFIEKSKSLIDSLYEHHLVNQDQVRIDDTTKNIDSISFYDSVVIFEKKLRDKPFHKQIGRKTITPYEVPAYTPPASQSILTKLLSFFNGKKQPVIHPFERNSAGINEIK